MTDAPTLLPPCRYCGRSDSYTEYRGAERRPEVTLWCRGCGVGITRRYDDRSPNDVRGAHEIVGAFHRGESIAAPPAAVDVNTKPDFSHGAPAVKETEADADEMERVRQAIYYAANDPEGEGLDDWPAMARAAIAASRAGEGT